MQLPVDVKAIINEAINIDEARHASLSVSIYIDDSAPSDVQTCVRRAFTSASPHARVSLIYLDSRPFLPYSGDDFAVIVAGLCENIGAYAAKLRHVGVAVMVVTTLPSLVSDLAKAEGYPIPEGDILSPQEVCVKRSVLALEEHSCADLDYSLEPYDLNKEAAALLSKRMGDWVIDICSEKRLAFALAFPFVRRPLSLESVSSTALQNAGIGFLFVIPGADMPLMTLNQAKMLLLIAAVYGEDLNVKRIKEFVALIGGAFVCRSVARQLVKCVPVLGWAVKAAVGYAGTMAMGYAAIEYYEGESGFAKISDAITAARNKVIHAAGKHVVDKMQATDIQIFGQANDIKTIRPMHDKTAD